MPSAHRLTAGLLRASSRAYANAVVQKLQAARPGMMEDALPASFASPVSDIDVRLQQIAASLLVDRPALLADVLAWYRIAFHHRGVHADYLPATLQAIESTLQHELPRAAFATLRAHLAAATAGLDEQPFELPSHLDKQAPHGELAIRFLLANLEGRGDEAVRMVEQARSGGAPIEELHDHVLVPVQQETGRMWLMGEIGVRDEHYGSEIVERVLSMLQFYVPVAGADAPRVVLFGATGDHHDLGQRLVAQRLQVGGFRVHNIGADLPAHELDGVLRDHACDLVAISATMLLHVPALVEQLRALRAAMLDVFGDEQARPVIVGGPPFRVVDDLHEAIGADASAKDAASAVEVARRLLARDPG